MKQYLQPEAEVILFKTSDVIMESGGQLTDKAVSQPDSWNAWK